MAEKEPVGKIEYLFSDEERTFFDKEGYLQAYREALDQFGVVGGFKATTLTKDAETRKAADDLIYGAFGEENPYDLEYYQKKYAPAAGEDQTREGKPIDPELGDEELEL